METEKIPHITCEHLIKLKAGELEHVVVDLRDPVEFESGHIEGSLNIPRPELRANIQSVIKDKEAKVIVIVGPTHEDEIRSVHETLQEMGYQNAEFLSGGFDRWCEIAPLELEDDLFETTPEEEGGEVDSSEEDIDPHSSQDEPMM